MSSIAEIDDERYEAPAAPGLDIIIRGLSMTLNDEQIQKYITQPDPTFG